MDSLSTTRFKNPPFRQGIFIIFGILISLVAVSWFFIQYDLDRVISSKFYFAENEEWIFVDRQPWKWLYEYGTIPGIVIILCLTILFFLSYLNPVYISWRPYIVLMILTSIIGGGVIVNGILKDYWGRPRPRQIEDFGGVWKYRELSEIGIAGKGKSFPCGHCTMGFTFVTFGFFYRKSKTIAISGVSVGLVYGGLMTTARVGQGAHFVSDGIWALGVILLTGVSLYYFFLHGYLESSLSQETDGQQRIGVLGFSTFIVFSAIILLFLTRRPVYDEYRAFLKFNPRLRYLHIRTNLQPEHIKIKYIDHHVGTIRTSTHGFGWPGATNEVNLMRKKIGQVFYVEYQLTSDGYFSEKNVETEIKILRRLKGKISFEFESNPFLEIDAMPFHNIYLNNSLYPMNFKDGIDRDLQL